ncbi:MAG: TerB family tellurite resistance protein [Sphingomonadales bacterium]
MVNRIKALFNTLKSENNPEAANIFSDKDIAAAALLVEAACMDGTLDEREAEVIQKLLTGRFHLNEEEAGDLYSVALAAKEDATHLMRFTRTIKENYSEGERIDLIEMLWEVAFADGIIHDFEENLIRRLAGLIYVSDRDRGDAKKRVQARIESGE